MKGFLLFCLATSTPNNKDALFNAWCSDVGIDCPGAEVRTTHTSVAGRGVFSTKNLAIGDEVISIPFYAALTQENAEGYFPALAEELHSARNKNTGKRALLKRICNRILRRPSQEEEEDPELVWQSELTAYALAAQEVSHPWSTWISQWKRADPLQNLVDRSTWRQDDEAIKMAWSDFHNMAPDIPEYKIGAAVGIRLQGLDEYSQLYRNKNVPTSESLYTTVGSRAIGLSDSVTAILPMHDMINHSPNPNVALAFGDDGALKLFATEDIPKDAEIFTTYKSVIGDEGNWDEDKAAWLLVQWGIPSSPLDSVEAKEEKASKNELGGSLVNA